jgi:hypothetical protein
MLPNDKRTSITELIEAWLTKDSFTILEAAELHGTLARCITSQSDKAERYFSVSKTHFVAQSRHDSTKFADFTARKQN